MGCEKPAERNAPTLASGDLVAVRGVPLHHCSRLPLSCVASRPRLCLRKSGPSKAGMAQLTLRFHAFDREVSATEDRPSSALPCLEGNATQRSHQRGPADPAAAASGRWPPTLLPRGRAPSSSFAESRENQIRSSRPPRFAPSPATPLGARRWSTSSAATMYASKRL